MVADGSSGSTPLQLWDVTIYYKFAFDVGRDIDPMDAAVRLLDTDVGVAAVHQGQQWDAARVRLIRQSKAQFEKVIESIHRLESGMGAHLRYVAAHPTLWPLFSKSLFRRSREGPDGAGGDDGDSEPLTFEEIDQAVLNAGMIQSFLELIDSQLYNPDFLKDRPWARIELQPVFLSAGGVEYAVDVWLLVHQSGSAVMTFVLHYDEGITVEDLVPLSMARGELYESTELPQWVVETSALNYSGHVVEDPDSTRFSSGITWGTWTHKEPVSLEGVFGVYQDAVLAALNAKVPSRPKGSGDPFATQWTCYPVICVRDTDERAFDRSDRDAQRQIGALVARIPEPPDIRTETLLSFVESDLSIRRDQRSWVNGGCAVSLISQERRQELADRYGGIESVPGQDWLWIEQMFAVPFDLILLQYHTGHALLSQVRSMPVDGKAVHTFKARLLRARASLIGSSHFAYGSVNLLADSFHDERRTQATWSLVDESVALVTDVLDAETRMAGERRSSALQSVLGIVAIVVGLPAIHELVQILGEIEMPADSWWMFGWLSGLTELAREHPYELVLGLFLGLLALVLVVFWRARRTRKDSTPFVLRGAGPQARKQPFQYSPGMGIRWEIATSRDPGSDAGGFEAEQDDPVEDDNDPGQAV